MASLGLVNFRAVCKREDDTRDKQFQLRLRSIKEERFYLLSLRPDITEICACFACATK